MLTSPAIVDTYISQAGGAKALTETITTKERLRVDKPAAPKQTHSFLPVFVQRDGAELTMKVMFDSFPRWLHDIVGHRHTYVFERSETLPSENR